MSRLHELVHLLLLCACITSCAQAFNFKSLFGGSEEGESEQPPAPFGTVVVEKSSRSDVPCNNYICPDTDLCVKTPKDCPCFNVTDKKCMVGDWYVCISGLDSCDTVL